ncbi:MAG: conserved exported protein of unknown function [Nitrospira sp.]|nr:MAG: conserved exported protein of unknown function [Nitrospira sp.]
MPVLVAASLLCSGLLFSLPGFAQGVTVEHVLRAQVFNRAFECVVFYSVAIGDGRLQTDGSREVATVASGRFLKHTKRVRRLVPMVGEQVPGGQVLQEAELPSCLLSEQGSSLSL